MANVVGTCFSVVEFPQGTTVPGLTVTTGGADYLRFHLFPASDGFGGPVVYPEEIKSRPELTVGGYLSSGIISTISGMCGCGSAANFTALRSPSAAVIDYGDTIVGGFTTTGCVGTRLTITGRPNELVEFTLDCFGLTTAAGSVSAYTVADTIFFPFERGTHGIGADTLLGFTLTFDTGYIPVYAMDGLAETGYAEIGERGANVTLELVMAHNATSYTTEYGKYTGVTAVNPVIVVTGSDDTATCTIDVDGYYTAWGFPGDVDGLMVHTATVTGHIAATTLLQIS